MDIPQRVGRGVLIDAIFLLIVHSVGGLRTDQELLSLLLTHLDQLRGTDTHHLLDWLGSFMYHVHLVKHVLLLRCAEDLLCVFTWHHS